MERDIMAEEWLTTKEAAETLEITVRSVVTRIHEGKLKAKRQGRFWLVHSSLSEPEVGVYVASEEAPSASVEFLRKQIEEKDKQIESLQRQLEASAASGERHDMILLQLTRQVEQGQRLLEDHRAPWFRRMFRKKASVQNEHSEI